MLDCKILLISLVRSFSNINSVVSIIWVHLGNKIVISGWLLPRQEIMYEFIFTPCLRDFNSAGKTLFCLCLAASSFT